jgi:hypothetical protein
MRISVATLEPPEKLIRAHMVVPTPFREGRAVIGVAAKTIGRALFVRLQAFEYIRPHTGIESDSIGPPVGGGVAPDLRSAVAA